MAKEWIKRNKGLHNTREVVAMAAKLQPTNSSLFNRYIVSECCQVLWEWADSETADGHIGGATPDFIDELVGLHGFFAAIEGENWVRLTDSGITVLNWERHNGKNAKKRAQDQQRQSKRRVTQTSRKERDKNVTREEKRREELIPPDASASTPTRGSPARRIRWTPEGGWTGIDNDDRRKWAEAYPACDLDRQLAAMTAWLEANPRKAKKSNWARYITNWLQKEQNRGGDTASNRPNHNASRVRTGSTTLNPNRTF